MVRQIGEALLDALSIDHRADLDAALPGHRHQLRVRVRDGISGQSYSNRRRAIRRQSCHQPAFHADLFRDEERAAGGSGHRDRVDDDHLVRGRCLACL
jgi:hypothetical protein